MFLGILPLVLYKRRRFSTYCIRHALALRHGHLIRNFVLQAGTIDRLLIVSLLLLHQTVTLLTINLSSVSSVRI